MLGPNCHPSVIVFDKELALMNAIAVVFPTSKSILCVWHIEKNILTNCKSSFQAQDDWNAFISLWNQVVASQDEALYDENWKHFELSYKDKEKILGYIRTTWLPFKDRFVRAWTDKYPHFGNRASSRVEGAHAKLKQYLKVSTGDLLKVKIGICLAIEREFGEIKAQLSSEKIRVPHKCNIPFFKELVTKVSVFAMGELLKQYDMVRYGTLQPRCTGNFNGSMGLPCAHMMMAQKGMQLPLDIIHSQWRIDMRSLTSLTSEQVDVGDDLKKLLCDLEIQYKDFPQAQKEQVRGTISQLVAQSPPLLFEPNIQTHKGRPLGSKKRNVSSTKRDTSQFEVVEATRKCSLCDEGGHNCRTCPKKVRTNETYPRRFMNETDMLDLNVAPTPFDPTYF